MDFCASYFLWPLCNGSFGTNLESNAAVTLQFDQLAITNYKSYKFKKKKIPFLKDSLLNNLRIFTNECTHILKQVIVYRKVFKFQRDSSVTFHVSPKTPNSEGSQKITSTKVQISPQKKFLEWFGPKTIEPICFQKSCMTNKLKLIFPKKCGFRKVLKGLKHLNTV